MTNWHDEMAQAVKQRQKAINGVTRWLEKKEAAEKVIESLSAAQRAGEDVPVVQPTENVNVLSYQSPVFSGPAASA